MAKRISDLRTTNKAGNTSREYVLLSNIDSNTNTKIALNDVLPTLQSGKATGSLSVGTLSNDVYDLFVGGGVGSGTANTDKSILIFKGIATSNVLTSGLTGTRALQLRTDKATADGTKQNVVVNLNQSLLDLSEADNTTSEFLSESGGSNPFNYTFSDDEWPPELKHCEMDSNIYYATGAYQESIDQLADLRIKGVDFNSVVSDPLFEGLEESGFKLKDNSPAVELGVKQIDFQNIGLIKNY